ncbi:ATP-binding cassette domain-containing protein [Leucobacter sp. NPDC077196]|uniref:ATP-binding cassette domain-containing protein n=1 Tax=Leucobacter sp. NPDC077196 TaxID=3154959 RepID=UPI00342857D5
MHSSKPTIVVHDLVKTFSLKHTQSFKESFVSMFSKEDRTTDFRALNGVSFEVGEGEALAVLGHNGSGKSTTLKLISGVQQPDSGWVRTRGRIGGLLEVGAGFHPDLTGNDNIYLNAAILGMSKDETDARYDEIVEFSGISEEFLDSEVKRYSSGMKSRLGFSVAVHTEVDVLLVDEVLSVGDAAFKAKCNDKILEMREQGKTMFVVSHSIGTVRKLCQRGIVLNQGELIFDGPIDEAVEYVRPPKVDKPRAPRAASAQKPEPRPKPEAPVNETRFTIAPEFMYLFLSKETQLGQPVDDPVEIAENGGGILQRFERGTATRSHALSITQFTRPGVFLDAYIAAGGPQGKWGFIVGRVEGAGSIDETVRIRFQNGIASRTGGSESPVEFSPAKLGAVTSTSAPTV